MLVNGWLGVVPYGDIHQLARVGANVVVPVALDWGAVHDQPFERPPTSTGAQPRDGYGQDSEYWEGTPLWGTNRESWP